MRFFSRNSQKFLTQVFNFHGFRFEVLKKRKHQVVSIRVTPEKPATPLVP